MKNRVELSPHLLVSMMKYCKSTNQAVSRSVQGSRKSTDLKRIRLAKRSKKHLFTRQSIREIKKAYYKSWPLLNLSSNWSITHNLIIISFKVETKIRSAHNILSNSKLYSPPWWKFQRLSWGSRQWALFHHLQQEKSSKKNPYSGTN